MYSLTTFYLVNRHKSHKGIGKYKMCYWSFRSFIDPFHAVNSAHSLGEGCMVVLWIWNDTHWQIVIKGGSKSMFSFHAINTTGLTVLASMLFSLSPLPSTTDSEVAQGPTQGHIQSGKVQYCTDWAESRKLQMWTCSAKVNIDSLMLHNTHIKIRLKR